MKHEMYCNSEQPGEMLRSQNITTRQVLQLEISWHFFVSRELCLLSTSDWLAGPWLCHNRGVMRLRLQYFLTSLGEQLSKCATLRI